MRPHFQTKGALKLAATGAFVGPCVDGLHNQKLLTYDVFPLVLGPLHTSAIVPPLLAVAYVILGFILPPLFRQFFGESRLRSTGLTTAQCAAFALPSTALIIAISGALRGSPGALTIITGLALAQWLALDATFSSFALATLAGIGGPLAETPFLLFDAWHYIDPDYFAFGLPDAGLDSITGPCYFAVTTDAIALGSWSSLRPDGDR